MELLQLFDSDYEKIRVSGFESRYLPFSQLKNYLDDNFPEKISLGKSFLGNDIFHLKIGTGNRNILAWSQMHGNESTGTRAMFDVLELLKLENNWSETILKTFTFHFIPMLNPDGSTLYTRRNASGIDLNRDFTQESSPEIKILKEFVKNYQFEYLFNLHDQRTIFNTENLPQTATLSFLAPAADIQRSMTDTRRNVMSVISYMNTHLQKYIPGKIGRFSDEFYPNSTGDNFTQMEIPTILFEAGHYPNDYQRDHTRKYNALAILLALDAIQQNKNFGTEGYFDIPQNGKMFLDVVLRNVLVKSSHSESLLDIGIYFQEQLNTKTHEIEFCAVIEEIGDLSNYFGHLDLDKKGQIFVGKSTIYPVFEEVADFSVGNIHFDNGKFIY
ncbi:M14 family zinc carboxypeptidase [Moheibacter sediminis]|uniref:Zinc carboxypeptidase n=1 Tax=Moheibacter sediminis TaxID=1434700 RepID=A0A1W2ALV5_9FLAO|nr:M14 family zinc carboxypeptidase [Moheibacter sediminis]SMC61643.1 Zinc carboxypeptidase [Moheibacter sediminis]